MKSKILYHLHWVKNAFIFMIVVTMSFNIYHWIVDLYNNYTYQYNGIYFEDYYVWDEVQGMTADRVLKKDAKLDIFYILYCNWRTDVSWTYETLWVDLYKNEEPVYYPERPVIQNTVPWDCTMDMSLKLMTEDFKLIRMMRLEDDFKILER